MGAPFFYLFPTLICSLIIAALDHQPVAGVKPRRELLTVWLIIQDDLSGTISCTIVLNGGELLVQKNLTIQGPGDGVITVSGDNVRRIFRFLPPTITPSINVRIFGLTICGGKVTKGGSVQRGG